MSAVPLFLCLCPVCNTGTGAEVRAGIATALIPLLAMAVVLVALLAITLWIHRRAPLRVAAMRRVPRGRALA